MSATESFDAIIIGSGQGVNRSPPTSLAPNGTPC